ncbi:hypothetical protein OC842_000072 [Tilletia horrida]|uniref:Ribosome biogenesis protein NSA1 n=1 Tax=Tilletia horrida TaxID=155126 RepID=A0AAN6GIU5_9BASI|nr:hypothetical protein OC842_000072 [Tilletia horrida]
MAAADEHGVAAQAWESAYRIFIADADGHLKVLRTAPAAAAPPAATPQTASKAKQQGQTQDAEAAEQNGDAAGQHLEEGTGPQLPCLQLLPIEGRPKIASPSFSSSSVNASPDAVQKMTGGRLASGHWILAIARRDASIDIVLPLPQPVAASPPDADYQPQRAVLIGTTTEDSMRAGMERWVGLSVASSGIYSCTSAGSLRFTPIIVGEEDASSSKAKLGLGLAEATTLKLPQAPLTHVVFATFPHSVNQQTSQAQDPTHFFCGGQDVPLSIWHLASALSSSGAQGPLATEAQQQQQQQPQPQQAAALAADNANEGEADLAALSGKQRKRKRQVEARNKAKELREGEVWRAKSLPNDALSLQQKPNISAIAILNYGSANSHPAPSDDAETSLPPGLQIGTATKTGLFRIYAPEPGSHQGKALHEFACLGGKGAEGKKKEAKGVKGTMAIGLIKKGVAAGGAEVKVVEVGTSEVFVADTQGKLYALDWKTQKLLYQYPNIDGAITSLQSIPSSSSSSPSTSLLFSTSLDRIFRLHSVTSPHQPSLHGKANPGGGRGKTLVEVFAGALHFGEHQEEEAEEMGGSLPAAPVAAVWDGQVPRPLPLPAHVEGGKGGGPRRGADGMDLGSEDEDEEDDEDVWDDMDQVGEEGAEDDAEDGTKRKHVDKKKRLG